MAFCVRRYSAAALARQLISPPQCSDQPQPASSSGDGGQKPVKIDGFDVEKNAKYTLDVHFPFEPYKCQRVYMEKVIFALDGVGFSCGLKGHNAALESPTGTGKTLSLLCAAIAWLLRRRREIAKQKQANADPHHPKIYYASRTHDQLRQVVRELNKTIYRRQIRVTTLASRDHLCLNEAVLREANNKAEGCHSKIRAGRCTFHREFKKTASIADEKLKQLYGAAGEKALDLREAKEEAEKKGLCPFFLARELCKFADLVLLPYNYLLEPEVRQRFAIQLKDDILIFDEAHNLESVAERSMSAELSTQTLTSAINEISRVISMRRQQMQRGGTREEGNANASNSPADWVAANQAEQEQQLKSHLKSLEHLIHSLDLGQGTGQTEQQQQQHSPGAMVAKLPCRVFPGSKLVEMIREAGFGDNNNICTLISRICAFLAERTDRNRWEAELFRLPRGVALSQFGVFISRVFMSMPPLIQTNKPEEEEDPSIKHYKLYVTEGLSPKGVRERKLHFCCFSAAVAMRLLQSRGTRSIIMTSGTLAPLNSFTASMGLDFEAQLESGHCARAEQLIVGALGRGPNGGELLGTFQKRNDSSYKQNVGELILRLARVTPQGMLVFFASYAQMDGFIRHWKGEEPGDGGQQLWAQMERRKTIFVEPKERADVPGLLQRFDKQVQAPGGGGALLLAVCRGKLSEGIDFADSHCRALVIVGIPFPPLLEPKVVLKRAHLAEQCRQQAEEQVKGIVAATQVMSPDDWYRVEGTRAVNQALGRIIRHKDDFGVVILADSRYARIDPKMFPSWLRPSIRIHSDSARLLGNIERFFAEPESRVEKSMQNAVETKAVVLRPKSWPRRRRWGEENIVEIYGWVTTIHS